MARRKRGVELFEVLSEHRPEAPQAEVPHPPVRAPDVDRRPPPEASPIRTGREIVLSVDLAFVIFVAVLILTGSAYFLGHRVGTREAHLTGVRDPQAPIAEGTPVSPLALQNSRSSNENGIFMPEESYTLKVRLSADLSDHELALLKQDRAYLLKQPEVKAAGVEEAYIYKSDSGKVYSLTLGVFKTAGMAKSKKLAEFVRKVDGPPHREGTPFRGCSEVKAALLGKPVL